MQRTPTRLLTAAITFTLMASCSTGPDRATPRPPTTAGGPRIVLAAALVGGQSCDDLLAWLRAEARTRVGPYGFDGGVVAYEAMEDMALPAAGAQRSATNEANADAGFDSPPSTAAPAPDSADGSTVGTNNQESGVDEIDRFKTDGRRVVMTDGQRLMAIDISGESPRLMGVVDLPMSGARLFLDGDRVLAVGAALYEEVPASSPSNRYLPYAERTTIATVDLASGAPVVGQTATVDGRIVDARSIDGLARLVLASPAGGGLEFPQPTEYERLTMKAAIAANQEIVDEAPIEAWLPRWTPAGGTETALLDCSEVYHPKEWAGPQILSVLTVGDDLATLNGVGVVTSGETVYASSTGLYVATQKVAQPELDDDGGLIWPEGDAASETTALHRFDISTKGAAVYQGSGEVPGHLINQYAMSEANGDLRVATTVGFGGRGVPMPMPVEDCPECAVSEPAIAPGEPAPAEVPGDDDRSTGVRSMLSVLRLKGDALEQIGRLDGLGPNEQIQSVRFVGARAYVVTFRQTDPLYVIDVADPTKPTLLGELKEPGFSSYLHPVGTDRMLGVGSSGTEDGQITGAKVTLYDTSDPTKPRAVTTVPITGGYSSAGGDAHAFNWDPARKLAFVPLSMSSDTEMVEGVAVYRVDGDAVTWVGFLSHRDHQGAPGPVIDCGGPTVECMPYPYRQSPVVDRVVIIGDSIYAASLAGVSRHAVDTLAETAWVGWS